MQNSPLISVIIPVYNSSEFLEQCLNSIIFQTYKNLEIICINDGSTDKSLDILNTFAQKDSRISVYSQTNKGVASARNFGLKVANGDFISFIDSDDWVLLDLYQVFYETISAVEEFVDIFMFNAVGYLPNQIDIPKRQFFDIEDINNHIDDKSIHKVVDITGPLLSNVSAANKIYNKIFLDRFNIKFVENLRFEDSIFNIETLVKSHNIMITGEAYYNYRVRKGTRDSMISSSVFDIFEISDRIYNILVETGAYNFYQTEFYYYMVKMYEIYYDYCPDENKADYYAKMQTILKRFYENLQGRQKERLSVYKVIPFILNSSYEKYSKTRAEYAKNGNV